MYHGELAQLGERLPCTQEVSGSTPLFSTTDVLRNAQSSRTHRRIVILVLLQRRQNPQTSFLPKQLPRNTLAAEHLSDGFVRFTVQRQREYLNKSGSNLGQTVSVCDEHELTDDLRSLVSHTQL